MWRKNFRVKAVEKILVIALVPLVNGLIYASVNTMFAWQLVDQHIIYLVNRMILWTKYTPIDHCIRISSK